MVVSRYERYIVRKPGVISNVTANRNTLEVLKGDKVPVKSRVDTGPLVLFSDDLVKDAASKVEYGFITGDTEIGGGKSFGAHKHYYREIFLFIGTDAKDTNKLGAEAEFWLVEGETLEKIKINTSSRVYVQPGVAHFPLKCKNVKSPVMMMVIVPTTSKHKAIPVKQ